MKQELVTKKTANSGTAPCLFGYKHKTFTAKTTKAVREIRDLEE